MEEIGISSGVMILHFHEESRSSCKACKYRKSVARKLIFMIKKNQHQRTSVSFQGFQECHILTQCTFAHAYIDDPDCSDAITCNYRLQPLDEASMSCDEITALQVSQLWNLTGSRIYFRRCRNKACSRSFAHFFCGHYAWIICSSVYAQITLRVSHPVHKRHATKRQSIRFDWFCVPTISVSVKTSR